MVRFAWLLPLTLALGLVLHYGAERFLPDSKADRLRRQRSQRGARRAGEPRHVGPVTLRGPGGELALPRSGRRVGLAGVQLETDTGKLASSERGGGHFLLDLNRAGCALMEVVTAPDLRSGEEAAEAAATEEGAQ